MVEIRELRKYLDEIKDGMQSITDLTLEMEEQSESLVSNIASFSGIGTRGGIIRSIVTRASTGTGLFNLTQRLTSGLLVLRYIEKSQKARLEEEREFNKLMNNREKIMSRLFKMQKDRLTVLDKEKYYNDASIKMKLKTLSIDDAILDSREQLEKATEKLRKAGRKALGLEASRMIGRGELRNFSANRFDFGGGRLGRFLGGVRNISDMGTFSASARGAGTLQMGQNELVAINERLSGLNKLKEETDEELETLALTFEDPDDDLSKAEKEAIKEEMKFLRETLRDISNTIEDVDNELERKTREFVEDIKDINKETGLEVSVRGRDGIGLYEMTDVESNTVEEIVEGITNALEAGDDDFLHAMEEISLGQRIALKYQKLKDKISERVEKVGKYFKGEDFKMIKSFFFKGLMVFGGLILGMVALVAVIYALYQLGVFEWGSFIKDVVKQYWTWTGDVFMWFLGGFYDLFMGTLDVVTGFFQFFSALFSGDGQKMAEAYVKIIEGLGKIGLGLVKVLVGGIGTLIMVGASMIGTVIMGAIGAVLGVLGKFFPNAKGAMIGGMAGGALGTAIGFSIGGPIGAKVGAGLGAAAGTFIGGRMETGGVTPNSGGMFLVGERGPELVSLPGNTRVFNNADTSRKMSPTININVTGRVGASDTELNDIARKIGQKINIEMNRYNSSGLRG